MTTLVRYEAARAALAAAHRVDEVKDIRDKYQALAAYARLAKDTELVELATEIKVRAERRAGELLRDMAERGERAPQHGDRYRESQAATLADLGVDKHQSARWQKLAAISDAKFELAVAAAKEIAGEVTTAALLKLNGPIQARNAGDHEWYTPEPYILAARSVLGGIDLDPASSREANAIVGARRFYTAADDGLSREWGGRVWMNPPYSGALIGQFMEKLATAVESGAVSAAVTLTNNATETDWFQRVGRISTGLALPDGRVKFWHPRKDAVPLQGQAVMYLGNDFDAFCGAFSGLGLVARFR